VGGAGGAPGEGTAVTPEMKCGAGDVEVFHDVGAEHDKCVVVGAHSIPEEVRALTYTSSADV
jgi:hypothetical protein